MTKISHLIDSCSDAATFYERKAVLLCTSVDSLKIRIPTQYVQIKCPELQDSIIGEVNLTTGRIIREKGRNKTHYLYPTGVETHYSHERMMIKQRPAPFVTVGLSSKLLKDRYFEGITADNIDLIHRELISQGFISCTFNNFVHQAICTDIDIKKDFKFNHGIELFKERLKAIEKNAPHSRKKGEGGQLFLQKNNLGLQFSDRKATAFKTAPYFKIYHKGVELKHKSHAFAKAHLNHLDYNDIIRSEATIKNKKHFQSLFGEDKGEATLATVVTLSNTEKEKVINYAKRLYINKKPLKIAQQLNSDQLKGNKLGWYSLVQMLKECGKTNEEIIERVLSLYPKEKKIQKSRMRKEITKFLHLSDKDERGEFCPLWNMIFE